VDAREAGGRKGNQSSQCAISECQSDQAAQNAKGYALEEQLARNASPSGTKGGADSKLLAAAFDLFSRRGYGATTMADIAREAVEEAFESLPKPRRRDPDEVAEAVRRAVRGAIAERWNKKPICHVHVLTV